MIEPPSLHPFRYSQVLMAQLKSPEELHYGSLALGDPMMGRGQDPTYAYLR